MAPLNLALYLTVCGFGPFSTGRLLAPSTGRVKAACPLLVFHPIKLTRRAAEPKLITFHTLCFLTCTGQAHNPDAHTKPLLEQTVVEETEQETSEDFEQPEGHQTPVETDNESLSFLLGDGANSLAEASAATDSSLEDDKCDSPRKHQLRKGRDRSNTWSHTHTASTFKTGEACAISFLVNVFLFNLLCNYAGIVGWVISKRRSEILMWTF